MSAAFHGRKHYTNQNVVASIDFNMRFTYVLVGWEGSAHDARILSDSLSRPDGLQIPENKLPPTQRNRPQNAKELLNLRHSSLRVAIKRLFVLLKNSFKALDQKLFHTFDTQLNLILACCIVHNWILGWGKDDFFEEVVIFTKLRPAMAWR
ncbi:uncharacterized protein [Lolium perenne]|uniref:uncharacterized protein n=1 Tax=Lolium perenne TaxID=4522 RepID=UPI003A99E17A